MDNLEPITRNEMFLNGDDLEPITREEMILAGADLEPLTRHEWFLKKYRGGGGGGEYDLVNIPNLPADIASFNDGTDLPMASLKVAVTPYQDLSHGDPSPSNICPISGWTEAEVSVINDSTKAPFFRGLLNGTYNFNDLGSLTWFKSGNDTFYTRLPDHKVVAGNSSINAISSNGMEFLQMPGSGNAEYIMITDSDYASYTAAQFREAMNGVYLIYELATPTTPTITPQQFNTLLEAFNINGHTTTIDLNGTRYGGTLDATDGTFLDMIDHIASYNGEALPSTWISDRDVYAEGTTPTIGAEVVYTRATPITVQLSPTPVKSLEGTNNIFANCGQITEGKYFKKA